MEEARRMAAHLKAQNWPPGSSVAILSRNCAWWLMADFAIWMAGHVSVPIYPSLNCSTVRQILEHSEARGCFLGAIDDKQVPACGLPAHVHLISLPTALTPSHNTWDAVVASTPPLTGNPERDGDDVATIIYTSGTTGAPKGAAHRFAALGFFAASATEWLGLTVEERAFSYLPLAHVIERCACELLGVFLGFHIYFTEGLATFLTDLKRAAPTIFPSVPRLLLKFQEGVFEKIPRRRLDMLLGIPLLSRFLKKRLLRELGLHATHYAASGGAALPLELLLWYRSLGLYLVEGYGLTETLATHLPARGQARPGYVGSAIPGVEVKVGYNSELLIKSPMNMVGYHKDPQGTRNAFTSDGFFRTGDVVQLDPDGQVRIIGRLKEQFKTSKGKYVAPAPLEAILMAHPAIESCCVMGDGLPSPFAVAVLSQEAQKLRAAPETRAALDQSMLARLNEINLHLDPHERLSFIAFVEGPWTIGNDLLTPTLKIKRAAVEGRYLAAASRWEKLKTPLVWDGGSAAGPQPAAHDD
jgi:long-chain acyl-CoA synthetase